MAVRGWIVSMNSESISHVFLRDLEKGRVHAWVQPQVDYISGRVSGGEMLCRWEKTPGVFVPAGHVIASLTEAGRLYELDRFMIDEACRLQRRCADVSVSVNLSQDDLICDDLPDDLAHMCSKYGVDPKKLHLEITEEVLASDVCHAADVAKTLQQEGFTLEIDDFGSGFSSLRSLYSLPADVLKLDRQFTATVFDPRGEAVLRHVFAMAKSLDMYVIAEGVENRRLAEKLSEMGCHRMQGYYFSQAVSPEEFLRLCHSMNTR